MGEILNIYYFLKISTDSYDNIEMENVDLSNKWTQITTMAYN